MAALAELAEENPNVEQQVREWQDARRANGEDPNDWAACREHLMAIGAPDPGDEEPDDFAS
jgi:hypothetical protein